MMFHTSTGHCGIILCLHGNERGKIDKTFNLGPRSPTEAAGMSGSNRFRVVSAVLVLQYLDPRRSINPEEVVKPEHLCTMSPIKVRGFCLSEQGTAYQFDVFALQLGGPTLM